MELQTKKCSKCGDEKALSEFGPAKHHRDGLRSACNRCRRDDPTEITCRKTYNAKRKEDIEYVMASRERTKKWYAANKNIPSKFISKRKKKEYTIKRICYIHKITYIEFHSMWKNQKGLCKICGSKLKIACGRMSERVNIDHCHMLESKYNVHLVRGLLCGSCNVLIGHAKENPLFIQKAIEYLERYSHA